MSDVSFKIVDSITKAPIPGIQVTVMSNRTSASTGLDSVSGSDGVFDISEYPYSGDTDKFMSFIDPSNKYGNAVYPIEGFSGPVELDPVNVTKTVGVPVLIGGVILLAIGAYFLFMNKK